jgi:hypothetical protein
MYGIEPTADLSFLREKTLIQVCFGPYDLQLRFAEEDTSISIQSTVGYGRPDGDFLRRTIGKDEGRSSILEDPCPLLDLLNQRVVGVSWTSDGTTSLEFENGSRLQIYDDSRQFESYNIWHNRKLLVI